VDHKLVKGAVKLRLAREAVGRAGSVKVDTFGGTVYLSGAVDTAHQKSDAEVAAWRVGGGRQVVNDIIVVPGPAAAARTCRTTTPAACWRASTRSGGATSSARARRRCPPTGRSIDHVSTYPLPERPDAPGPHYALVLWHVSEAEVAALR
jgi:BON domain